MWSKPLICCSCNVLVQDLFPVTLTFPHLLSSAAWSKAMHESCCKQIWLTINEDKASDLFRGLVFLIAHVLCVHRNAKHRAWNVEKYKKKIQRRTDICIHKKQRMFVSACLFIIFDVLRILNAPPVEKNRSLTLALSSPSTWGCQVRMLRSSWMNLTAAPSIDYDLDRQRRHRNWGGKHGPKAECKHLCSFKPINREGPVTAPIGEHSHPPLLLH